MSMTNSYNRCKSFRTTTLPRKACKLNVRVKVPTQGVVPRTSFGWYDYGIGEKKVQNEHPRLPQLWQYPNSATLVTSATSGTSRDFWEKKRRRRSKIGFYFFTYEWSRRRFSLIKTVHEQEEVLVLLFTAFGYEYLFEVPSYAFE